MGEVGTNSTDNPIHNININGLINGIYGEEEKQQHRIDDDIDSRESNDISIKKSTIEQNNLINSISTTTNNIQNDDTMDDLSSSQQSDEIIEKNGKLDEQMITSTTTSTPSSSTTIVDNGNSEVTQNDSNKKDPEMISINNNIEKPKEQEQINEIIDADDDDDDDDGDDDDDDDDEEDDDDDDDDVIITETELRKAPDDVIHDIRDDEDDLEDDDADDDDDDDDDDNDDDGREGDELEDNNNNNNNNNNEEDDDLNDDDNINGNDDDEDEEENNIAIQNDECDDNDADNINSEEDDHLENLQNNVKLPKVNEKIQENAIDTSTYDELGENVSNDCELLPDPTEIIHSISDSDDENDSVDMNKKKLKKNEINPLQEIDDVAEKSMQSDGGVGARVGDGDHVSVIVNNEKISKIHVVNEKPLSIHSDDSDTEDIKMLDNERDSIKNGDCKTPEIHEILSDKEDCVVIEDDSNNKKDDEVDGDGKQLQIQKELISPRRSQRTRKSVVKVRDFSVFDDDIEEVIDDQDPLQQPLQKKLKTSPAVTSAGVSVISQTQTQPQQQSQIMQIAINDARSLAPSAASAISGSITNTSFQQQFIQQANPKQKEPTLVIIDTNSILSRGGVGNMGQQSIQHNNSKHNNFAASNQIGAQGMYHPSNMRASITPILSSPQNNQMMPKPMNSTSLSIPNVPLLPALTDDMFVLEAPSFIVPYIYEKPPNANLKEVVDKMTLELEEMRKKQKAENDKVKASGDDVVMKNASDIDEDNADGAKKTIDDKEQTEKEKSIEDKQRQQLKKKKHVKNADDSWDESDTSTDDEASDNDERTKVLIKEIKEDLDSIKTHIITTDSIVKSSSSTTSPSSASLNTSSTATSISTTTTTTTTTTGVGTINTATNGAIAAADQRRYDNYFDSPLGNFFMDIGINLVQEHVQTDLLRQQKKKLIKEGTKPSPSVQMAINSLMKNLELSKLKNEVFKYETKRCEYCNFKTESSLAMAHHYETPHMHNHLYKCNFCAFQTRPPYDILFHMEAIHNIKGRLEKAPCYHQCPNCLFEDNGRSKLGRHTLVCSKKFRPETNLNPPIDWEPPAKIPRIKPRHGLVGTATAYQAMAAQAQRAASGAAALQRQNLANAALLRNRGRPQQPVMNNTKPIPVGSILRANQPGSIRPQNMAGMILPNNFQLAAAGQFIQVSGTGMAMVPNNQNAYILQAPGPKSSKSVQSQQPSISITPLPRQPAGLNSINSLHSAPSPSIRPPSGISNLKPGQQNVQNNKASFVICEICDGYIKDLDQLRNHMQWMHKVKIHPKMIYNRPPLNCQKCQFRFFTDQGLERHLLGSHGLVTSSMQEAANKGKDAGRCPVCGKMYQWKLLNHVSRDHNMTLKPAHLSYKCTVCTATFGMYKQFENHVYSAHSTVAKKNVDGKKSSSSSSSSSTIISNNNHRSSNNSNNINHHNNSESLFKPLKINDEITIIPQPASRSSRMEIESHIID